MLGYCEAHDDCIVVYNSKKCPMCKALKDSDDSLDEANDKLFDTQLELENLKNQQE